LLDVPPHFEKKLQTWLEKLEWGIARARKKVSHVLIP